MTKIPFPLKGQTTGTIRASSSFLEKNPTTTLHLQPPPTITLHHHHLSLVQSNRVKLVKLGAVSTLLTLLETGLAGRALLVLCNLAASSEGKSAMLDSNAIECLFQKLRNEKVDSNESTRENCVACLYSLSIGSMRFKGLARAARATEVLRVVEETGSERAREKAKRMLMILRERDDEEGRDWDALLEGGMIQSRYRGISTKF
ncbi:putative armadillo-like helical protein [Helianthus annuus]|nr:putative armadillo-like helical protein [Helianthus annuus]KAJ0938013.1 putative armadillo-like helical protein [Helianthus annuus]